MGVSIMYCKYVLFAFSLERVTCVTQLFSELYKIEQIVGLVFYLFNIGLVFQDKTFRHPYISAIGSHT